MLKTNVPIFLAYLNFNDPPDVSIKGLIVIENNSEYQSILNHFQEKSPTEKGKGSWGRRYEARSRGRSSPDSLAFGACETARR